MNVAEIWFNCCRNSLSEIDIVKVFFMLKNKFTIRPTIANIIHRRITSQSSRNDNNNSSTSTSNGLFNALALCFIFVFINKPKVSFTFSINNKIRMQTNTKQPIYTIIEMRNEDEIFFKF